MCPSSKLELVFLVKYRAREELENRAGGAKKTDPMDLMTGEIQEEKGGNDDSLTEAHRGVQNKIA